MIVNIHQPSYLSWLGNFDRIRKCDVHVVLDHVSMGSDGIANRNYIRTADGPKLLTIPIKNRGDDTPIRDIQIADTKWQRKHIGAIQAAYARAPFFPSRWPWFRDCIEGDHTSLMELIDQMRPYFFTAFDITTPVVYSSKLIEEGHALGKKSQLNLDICKILGATKYLSGPNGRGYLDMKSFADENIAVEFHDYEHPVYRQCFGGFVPRMSALDAVFNCEGFPE